MTAPTSTDPQRIVVVGASLAGMHAAEELRRRGYTGRLTMIGDEPHLPYDRPPLSKVIAAGRMEPGHQQLPQPFDLGIDWRLGVRAVGLDRGAGTVLLDDGGSVAYDRLLIATGTRPRPWPDEDEAGLDGVLTVHTHEDGVELRRRLDAGPRRVVVLGSGFTGSELASVCRERGIEVTLLERSGFPLQGALGQTVGAAIGVHQQQCGVDLRTRTAVESLVVDGGRVTGARLTDGGAVEADLVVAAIGTLRNVEWLEGSGLAVARVGVLCDGHLRAVVERGGDEVDGETVDDDDEVDEVDEVDEAVFVAGDVAACPLPRFRNLVVGVEHWGNAVDQGRHAARSMLGVGRRGGGPEVFDQLPRFWSNQFGLNIKSIGVPSFADSIVVTQGALDGARSVIVYGREGLTCGAVAINAPRELEGYEPMMVGPFPPPFTAPDWRDRTPPEPVPARIPHRSETSHDAPSEVFDPTAEDLLPALGVTDPDPAVVAATRALS